MAWLAVFAIAWVVLWAFYGFSYMARPGTGQIMQFSHEPAGIVEEFFWPITAHPLLDDTQVLRIRLHVNYGHLMRTPRALDLMPVDLLRASPSLG